MNTLELVLKSHEIINKLDEKFLFGGEPMITTIHTHYDIPQLTIHGMDGLDDMRLILDDGVFILGNHLIEPTPEQQKIIDRVNEIMKEEV